MEKMAFILSSTESQGKEQLCITHHKDISQEEYNRILEAVFFCDLEINPHYIYRLDDDLIRSGLCSMSKDDYQNTSIHIIEKEQFESVVLDIKSTNKSVRELFGLPVSMFEYFDPLPDAYREDTIEDSPYKEDITPKHERLDEKHKDKES